MDEEELVGGGDATSYAGTQPAATPVEPVTEPDLESDLWGKLDEAFDHDPGEDANLTEDVPAPAAATPPVVSEAPIEPAAQPPVVEAPVVPPVVEQQTAPQEQQQVLQQPQVQLPDATQLAAVRDQYLGQLAQTYALDEATAELVDTNFSAVAPQLMSQMHMRIAESVTQTLGQMLPQLINMQVAQQQAVEKQIGEFYGQWPELSRPEYQPVLAQIAQTYRQFRPNASQAEFYRDVGIQAWGALGLPMDQLLTRGQQQAAPPVQQSPQIPSGGYAPATPGAPARSQTPPAPASNNVFTQFAEEFLADD
jgi:hypothetical protein